MIGAPLGAVFGGSAAEIINSAIPGNVAVAQPQAYALVGIAATLASACSVPLTSVLLLFELTKDYRILLALLARLQVPETVVQQIFLLRSLDVELYKHAQEDIFAQQRKHLAEKLDKVEDRFFNDLLPHCIRVMQDCPFLEVHYDRIGKDGLFSHKEITVLFVPDLSGCLPLWELWHSQWHAYKKAIIEREQQLAVKREKRSSERKENVKGDRSHGKCGKDVDSTKSVKKEDNLVKDEKETIKTIDAAPCEQASNIVKMEKVNDDKNITEENETVLIEKGSDGDRKRVEIKVEEVGGEGELNEKRECDGISASQATSGVEKPVRKKIIKKVTKVKTADKKSNVDKTVSKQNEMEEKDGGKETTGQQDKLLLIHQALKNLQARKLQRRFL